MKNFLKAALNITLNVALEAGVFAVITLSKWLGDLLLAFVIAIPVWAVLWLAAKQHGYPVYLLDVLALSYVATVTRNFLRK